MGAPTGASSDAATTAPFKFTVEFEPVFDLNAAITTLRIAREQAAQAYRDYDLGRSALQELIKPFIGTPVLIETPNVTSPCVGIITLLDYEAIILWSLNSRGESLTCQMSDVERLERITSYVWFGDHASKAIPEMQSALIANRALRNTREATNREQIKAHELLGKSLEKQRSRLVRLTKVSEQEGGSLFTVNGQLIEVPAIGGEDFGQVRIFDFHTLQELDVSLTASSEVFAITRLTA